MEPTKKQLVALVYVGVSLIVAAWGVQLTSVQTQWFSAFSNLRPDVGPVSFAFYPNNSTGLASLTASVTNPTNFGLSLTSISFVIFANSTSEDFSARGSSEVAASGVGLDALLPAHGYINVTSSATIYIDAVNQLNAFLANHTADARIFVQTNLYLRSPFGILAPTYCFEAPGRPVSVCPLSRFG